MRFIVLIITTTLITFNIFADSRGDIPDNAYTCTTHPAHETENENETLFYAYKIDNDTKWIFNFKLIQGAKVPSETIVIINYGFFPFEIDSLFVGKNIIFKNSLHITNFLTLNPISERREVNSTFIFKYIRRQHDKDKNLGVNEMFFHGIIPNSQHNKLTSAQFFCTNETTELLID